VLALISIGVFGCDEDLLDRGNARRHGSAWRRLVGSGRRWRGHAAGTGNDRDGDVDGGSDDGLGGDGRGDGSDGDGN
jgi:hypothetical protein